MNQAVGPEDPAVIRDGLIDDERTEFVAAGAGDA